MEAAKQNIEQGQLNYAVHLLEKLANSDSISAEQAKLMLVKLRTVKFVQTRTNNVVIKTD